jgi:alpha-glucosidase (family GH31 glycosyl hydrolase)
MKSPTNHSAKAAWCIAVASGYLLAPSFSRGQPTPIRFHDAPAELSISEVTDHTLQVILSPIDDETGQPRPEPPSNVLVEHRPQVKLRRGSLQADEKITIGKLIVEVKPKPLAIAIRRPNGDLVQELTFDGDTMSFRAEAPIFGMGEGAQQLDRRGANYSMRDGWGAWERPTHGSWVAVPFLIGVDGWAMLVHHPLGEFDLRGPAAKFSPWIGQADSPFVAYVIAWEKPAEALSEYARLTGPAPLPPKWTLGYMQSHRTLAGPQEVLHVARTFREKKLPCDALIYLGTGYCPAGWNIGHASVEFNPATFDKPDEMLTTLHEEHFHVVLHQNAPPRRLTGLQIKRIEADELDENDARPNRPASDISRYWARHRETFLRGVDGWWPDDGDELRRESRIARHRMYYEGPLQMRAHGASIAPDMRACSATAAGSGPATSIALGAHSPPRSQSARTIRSVCRPTGEPTSAASIRRASSRASCMCVGSNSARSVHLFGPTGERGIFGCPGAGTPASWDRMNTIVRWI